MAVETYTIFQGDTGPIVRARPSVLAADATLSVGWECYIAVNDTDGTTVIPRREVTDKTVDLLRWEAALTPTETGTLTIASGARYTKYSMVIEILNVSVTPPFNVERHYGLKVYPQGMVPA